MNCRSVANIAGLVCIAALRLSVWLLGVSVAAILTTLTSSAIAQADSCLSLPEERCYALANDEFGPFYGIYADWDIQELGAADWGIGGHALQAMWGPTNTTYPGEWVEVGYIHGKINEQYGYRGFYWAERVEGWGYAEYRVNNISPGPLGTRHTFRIERYGTGWVFRVYIDNVCVQAVEQVPCESSQNYLIVRHDVGSETTDTTSKVGPTHARSLWNLPTSGGWKDWAPTCSDCVTTTIAGSDQFEWYGDYKTALFGKNFQFLDNFERSDGSFPDWPELVEGAGNDLYIHYIGPDAQNPTRRWSHVHAKYDVGGGNYLLLRKSKNDSYTGSPIVIEFGYGEHGYQNNTQAGRMFTVWNSDGSTALGIGAITSLPYPNNYFYRVDSAPIFYDTGILRNSDWHIFRFYIRWPEEGCSYGELDGVNLYERTGQRNCSITPDTALKYGLVSDWNLVDQPTGYHGIWDNAVYDHN